MNQIRINQVFIVQAAGHSDDNGNYTRGKCSDCYSELDIVNSYARKIVEILDEYQVRNIIMATRNPPGCRESRRWEKVPGNSLVVSLGVGYYKNPCTRIKNSSAVYFGKQKEAKELAELLSDDLSSWGACSSFGHRVETPNPSAEALLNVEGCLGIRIEPFSINGPNCEDYVKRLDSLGREVGMALVEFLGLRSFASCCQLNSVSQFR